MPASTQKPQPTATTRLVHGLILLVVAILPPLVVCGAILGAPSAALLLFGVLVGTLNTLTGGTRLGLLASVAFLLLTPVSLTAGTVPLAGASLMAFVCLFVGTSAGWGLNHALALIPLGMAYLMAMPQPIMGDTEANPTATTYLVAILIGSAICAFWSVAAVTLLVRKKDIPRPPRNSKGDTIQYTITITVLVSVATFYVLTYARESHGVWLILTLIVVLQTGPQSTVKRALQRTGGTVLGALLGAGLVSLVDNTVVLYVLLVVSLLGALIYIGSSPYWLYATFLTLVIVLGAAPSGHAVEASMQRGFYTVVGAIIAVIAIMIGSLFRSDGLSARSFGLTPPKERKAGA